MHHLHGRHIGVAVAKEDHTVERDRTIFVRDEVVDPLVFPVVFHALVDAEQILGLGGVVDAHRRPCGLAVLVIDIVAGKDMVQCRTDRRAVDHFLKACRDDVMLDLEIVLGPELIDAIKP